MTARTCPSCGAPLVTGYRPAFTGDGDVEPWAVCTDPACPYAY